MTTEPSDTLRKRVIKHIQATDTRVTKIATDTGVGYYRLLRWIKQDTYTISYDDAHKVLEYLGEA